MKQAGKHHTPSLISLKRIFEETSEYTGQAFFRSLVCNLAQVLDVHGVWVTEFREKENRLNSLAFWLDGRFVEKYEYDVKGTPCERVLESENICHIPEKVIELYPDDPDLPPLGAVSYMGLVLKDETEKILGHLALLDREPMEEIPEIFLIFRLFASRAQAELRRVQYEKRLRESEARINRLLNGTMDAIIELDSALCITQANEAALNVFRIKPDVFLGKPVSQFLNEEAFQQIRQTLPLLKKEHEPLKAIWLEGHLECLKATKESFPADATMSCYEAEGKTFYALYIRDVNERIRKEEEIRKLTIETTVLREKVDDRQMNSIVGESEALQQVFVQISQVAPTDSTVLILGETGTGKELIARDIHQRSARKDKPFIPVNCAALPSELIESELFGHVKGAFTGATDNREGRFFLADKGTIFLDEIGELPLALQAKLLRVIQEGEFEPVGSSTTRKVNVRIVAATHRDLKKAVANHHFREDLFYRLNVFPIRVPPLRERGQDIILLAEAFLKKYSSRLGIKISPLQDADKEKLLKYSWPGNVRELQNITERAVITSQRGLLSLSPDSVQETVQETKPKEISLITYDDIRQLEIANLQLALEKTKGRIFGPKGAARLLGIPPTTLISKLKKFDLDTDPQP